MNDESHPKVAPAAAGDRDPTVAPGTDTTASAHQAWECDGHRYSASGEWLGKCLEHRGMVKPLTRVQGVDRALDESGQTWRQQAEQAVRRAIATGRPFSVDELRGPPYDVPEPDSPGAWGALVLVLKQRGLIERVGDRQTTRRAGRHRTVKLWQGTTSATPR